MSVAHATAPQDMDSGDFVYRVRQPDAAMGMLSRTQTISFTTVSTHRARLMRDADVLVLQMLGDPDLLPVILDRRARHRLTVYEISDNFLAFQPSNPAAAFYADPANRACIMQLAAMSHAVQFTTPELENRFAHLNENRAVFMNQMTSLGDPARQDSETVRVGWGGSLGHLQDIAHMAPFLIHWLERTPIARLCLMANSKITSLFDTVPEARKTITRPGSLHQYYAFLQTLDIGLAPMVEVDAFNACRSDVKFVEYASRGAVPVCSNAAPYRHTVRHGETGFLFDSFEDMCFQLDTLCADRALMHRIGGNAFSYVRHQRSAAADAKARRVFYEQLMTKHQCASNGYLSGLETIPGAANTKGGRHWLIRFGPVEQCLHDGLAARFRNNDPGSAMALLNRAVELAPDFPAARIYRANVIAEHAPERAFADLEQAMSADPDAISATLLAARLVSASGRMDEGIAMLQTLVSRIPECAQAHALLGELNRSAKNALPALRYFEAALEANPWFSPAATQAGALFLESGDFEKARCMFESAMQTASDIPGNHLGLAAALFRGGDIPEAAQHLQKAIELNPALDEAAELLLDISKKTYRNGNWDLAADMLGPVQHLRPRDMECAFWLARSLDRAGRREQAQSVWRHIAAHDHSGRFIQIANDWLKAHDNECGS